MRLYVLLCLLASFGLTTLSSPGVAAAQSAVAMGNSSPSAAFIHPPPRTENSSTALAAGRSTAEQNSTGIESNAPRIAKIDPPNWWLQLPSPMLLLQGENLYAATFTTSARDVKIERVERSANGHWAFLWINTTQAAAQTFTLTATNASGSAKAIYTLAERQKNGGGLQGFHSSDVMYLIMPDRFADGGKMPLAREDRSKPRAWHGGTLAGIEQHLDYLQQLGITALWTTPVVGNGATVESYHGYAATDLYSIDPHFGSLADYTHLAAALHQRGMKLIIDLVPNHISIAHPWVSDPPAPEWFHGTAQAHPNVVHDFYRIIDPHTTAQAAAPVTHGWFTDAMPDLNQSNPLVASYLTENALWWIESARLDGLRLDTFPYVDRAFWSSFLSAIHSANPQLTAVGEVFHRDPVVTSYFAGDVQRSGLGERVNTHLDTPFDFPLYFALRDVLGHNKPMSSITDVLRQDALYPHPERLVTFIGNHDTTRLMTEFAGSAAHVKLALGLISTMRGLPMIYSGDEIGLTGGDDPENRHDFPGGFAGDHRSAFTVADRTAAENTLHDWTAKLLVFRAAHAELQTGLEQNLAVDDESFAFVRSASFEGCVADHDHVRFLIIVNRAQSAHPIKIDVDQTALAGCTAFTTALQMKDGEALEPSIHAGQLQVLAPAESLTIYAVR